MNNFEKAIYKNDFIRIKLSKYTSLRKRLEYGFKELEENKKIVNINSLYKKLECTNSDNDLISLMGEIETAIFLSIKPFKKIDVAGKKLPSGRRVDIVTLYDSKNIFFEVKAPIKEMERLLNTQEVIMVRDYESIRDDALEALKNDTGKSQFSETSPNVLVYYLGNSIADKDDFESVFEDIATDSRKKIVRKEGLFYKSGFECLSAVLAIRNFRLYYFKENPNVKTELRLSDEIIKEIN